MKNTIFAIVILLFCSTYLFAQEDAKGCNDIPNFVRMSDMYIAECSSNADVLVFPTGDESSVTKQGIKTSIKYSFNTKSKVPAPSFTEIEKHYENIITGRGGKKIYLNNNEGVATLYTKTIGKDIWVILNDQSKTSPGSFELITLDVEEVPQNIDANEMLNDIKRNGKVVLYITFEVNSTTIRPASNGIVDQLALLLKDNPSLKVSIEGHTDNSGDKNADQVLSENRAKLVMNAVLAQGIDASQLSFKGWGHNKPIDDNNTEEAKFKNRRIEIVKM